MAFRCTNRLLYHINGIALNGPIVNQILTKRIEASSVNLISKNNPIKPNLTSFRQYQTSNKVITPNSTKFTQFAPHRMTSPNVISTTATKFHSKNLPYTRRSLFSTTQPQPQPQQPQQPPQAILNAQPITIDSPPPLVSHEQTTLNQLAAELAIDPITGKKLKLAKKRSIWFRLGQVVLFSMGFTTTAILSVAYRHRIISKYFELLLEYRIWSGDFAHVREYATEEYLHKTLPIEFVKGADIDDNILNLQKIWFHRTFIMKNLLNQISAQLSQIGTAFSNYNPLIIAENDKIMSVYNDPDHQDDVKAFMLLNQDIQALLDNSQVSRNEIEEFRIVLSQANSEFAINTKKWKNVADKTAFFENLEMSVHEGALYIDRMQELLATAIQHNMRFKRFGSFIQNRHGYLEYRQQIMDEDDKRRAEYELAIADIQSKLHSMQEERDSMRVELPSKEQISKTVDNNPKVTPPPPPPLPKEPYSFEANQAKTPPAMHLDLNKFEQQKRE
jgi:hypothetical protein